MDGEPERHPPKDLRWAKHLNGWFYWGKDAEDKPGQWVRICIHCINGLAQD